LRFLLEAERVLRRWAKAKAKKKKKKARMTVMTQKEAAAELGVTHTAVQRYRRVGLLREYLPEVRMRSVLLDAADVYALKGKGPRPGRGRPRKAR
jgi:hypothetical protein